MFKFIKRISCFESRMDARIENSIRYHQGFKLERDLSRVFFTKNFAVIYEFIFFNFLIKDRQTSVNLNFHVIKENLKRSKLKLV